MQIGIHFPFVLRRISEDLQLVQEGRSAPASGQAAESPSYQTTVASPGGCCKKNEETSTRILNLKKDRTQ